MKVATAAERLAELGHTTRLEVFRYLVKHGRKGAPVGDIQSKLGVPGSTLTHHISRLMSVGLVEQRREGRTLYCVSRNDELESLIEFLKEECCVHEPGDQDSPR
jgi:DNA-binding transcriptional ArsR family regulator